MDRYFKSTAHYITSARYFSRLTYSEYHKWFLFLLIEFDFKHRIIFYYYRLCGIKMEIVFPYESVKISVTGCSFKAAHEFIN